MDFLEIAKKRYTTKKYSDKKVPENKIQELKEILRLSPSSINSQPWKFVFIEDEETKFNLSKVSNFNEHKVNDASHLVVFCVIDSEEKFLEQLKENTSEANLERYLHYMEMKPKAEIKPWMKKQLYIALGFFLSACAASNIDATPMEGIQQKEYDNILKIDAYKTLFAVSIGYRAEDDQNQPSITPKLRLPIEKVITSI
jgi:nitroreductase/dihydropteridine reductase